ncbi:MAG: hypothetical protein PUC21_08430, partial [Bacteroidales bacterium]|nr:hypothetical protein [Bacteroidales bacterium]
MSATQIGESPQLDTSNDSIESPVSIRARHRTRPDSVKRIKRTLPTIVVPPRPGAKPSKIE